MSTRAQIVATALASVRLEGLEPSDETLELGPAWARGSITGDDLAAAEQRLLDAAATTPTHDAR